MAAFPRSALEQILEVQRRAAVEAGERIIAVRRSRNLSVRLKGARDLVTAADLAAEESVLRHVREHYPDHVILSEESSPKLAPDKLLAPLWVIDPLDGTMNFAHGHLQVAVSIAFAHEGKVLAATVHAPFLNETFCAIRGGGATLNGVPIAPSSSTELGDALISTGFPTKRDDVDSLAARVHRILSNCRDLRRLGSAALDGCWVACGRLDGYFEYINPWDIAAAGLIAREAGARTGFFVAPTNKEMPEELSGEAFLVTAPALFDKINSILAL